MTMDVESSRLIMQIVIAFFTLLGSIFTGIMAYLMAKLKMQQELAAKEVLVVKAQLEETGAKVEKASTQTVEQLIKIADTSEKSHDLANSFMLEQKRQLAQTAKDLAEYTKLPEHIKAAEIAKSAYVAHKITDERMKAVENKEDKTQVVKSQVVEVQVVKKTEE